jgi:hypothetical protein
LPWNSEGPEKFLFYFIFFFVVETTLGQPQQTHEWITLGSWDLPVLRSWIFWNPELLLRSPVCWKLPPKYNSHGAECETGMQVTPDTQRLFSRTIQLDLKPGHWLLSCTWIPGSHQCGQSCFSPGLTRGTPPPVTCATWALVLWMH